MVPIHFSGQNSNFFYRLANFSDKYLPFNLAMLFLVDEMYKNEDNHAGFQEFYLELARKYGAVRGKYVTAVIWLTYVPAQLCLITGIFLTRSVFA